MPWVPWQRTRRYASCLGAPALGMAVALTELAPAYGRRGDAPPSFTVPFEPPCRRRERRRAAPTAPEPEVVPGGPR